MELFTYSVDLARIVFLMGAVLAMAYKKLFGITPGGIIVPAFLALLLDQNFIWFLVIVSAALLTRLVYRLIFESHALSRSWVVYTNICISAMLVLVAQLFLSSSINDFDGATFGFVISGLMAANSVKYGTGKVFMGALSVTALTYTAGFLLSEIVPFSMTTSLTTQLGEFAPLKMNAPQLFLPAGLLITGVIMHRYGVRTGGFLLAPFVALLAAQSLVQFATFVVGVTLSYIIIQIVLHYSLVVGLERFMVCLLLAACCVSLTDLIAIRYNLPGYHSTSMVLMVAMGVMVNDLCLQKKKLPALGGLTIPVAIAYGLRLVVR